MNDIFRHLPLLFAPAILLAVTPAHADSDFQLWTEAGVSYDVSKRIRVGFDQHVRCENDASRVESVMPEAYLRWRPKKWLHFTAGYRFIAEPVYSLGETYWDAWHRPYADGEWRGKFGDFGLRYRLRYQEEFGKPWDEDGERVRKHTLRNRVGLYWFLHRDWSLGLKNELHVRFGDDDGALHKYRTLVELGWDLGSHEPSVFVGRDDRLDDDLEPTVYIAGLAYQYEL